MKTKIFTLLVLLLAFSVGTVKATLTDPLVLSNFDAVNTVPDAFTGFTYTYITATGTNASISTGNCLNVSKSVSGANPLVFNGVSAAGIFGGSGVSIGANATTQYRYLVIRAKKGNASYSFNAKFETPVTVTNPVTLPLYVEPTNAYVQGAWVTYVFDLSRANNTYKKLSLYPENNAATTNYNTQLDDIFFTNTIDATLFASFQPAAINVARSAPDAVTITFPPMANASYYRVYNSAGAIVKDNITGLTTIPFTMPTNSSTNSAYIFNYGTLSTMTTSKLSTTVTGLSLNTSYTLQVVGVNASGVECTKSAAVTIVTRKAPAGSNYSIVDDFESGAYSSTGWIYSNLVFPTVPSDNPVITGINSSAKCAKIDYQVNAAGYAGLSMSNNECITVGPNAPYKYLHFKLYSTTAITTNPIVGITLTNAPKIPDLQLGITIPYNPANNYGLWTDYVIDLSAYTGANATSSSIEFNGFYIIPLSFAVSPTILPASSYIDDVYFSNDATPLNRKLEPVTVTLASNDVSKGTVSGTGKFLKGVSATVNATPASGYALLNWTDETGNVVSTNGTFTPTRDITLTANFTAGYTITTSATNGTVAGGGAFASGATVSLVATPAAGYSFVNWTEGATILGTSSSLASFTASANRTIVANFTNNITVSVTTPPNAFGYVGAGPSAENKFTVAGTGLTGVITITPPIDYEISKTTATGFVGSGSSLTLTPATGTVTTTNIFVRLKAGLSVANYNENIGISTPGVTSNNVSCIGIVATAAPTIGGATAVTIGGTTAVISANVTADGGAPITSRGICWNTLTTPTTGNSKTTDAPGLGNVYSSLTSLTASTIYYARPYVTNSTGTYYGAQLQFTTPAVVAAQTALAAASVSYTTLTLNWTASATASTTNEIYQDGVLIGTTAAGTNTYNVTGLKPGVRYTFSLKAVLAGTGSSDFSATPLNQYTLIASPPSALTSSAITATGLTLTWAASVTSGATYEIFKNGISIGTTNASTLTYNVTGLTVGTNSFVVKAIVSNTYSVGSNAVTIQTYTEACTPNDGTMGSVTGTGVNNAGSSISLTAIPNSGYSFSNWTENGVQVSTTNPYTYTVTADRTLVANFVTIGLSTTSITVASPVYGSSSAEQSFTISGSSLTGDITLTPPANYEISTGTGDSFAATNPITLTQNSGSVASTPIYVRLIAGSAVGSYNNQNIVVASAGFPNLNVVCSGSVTKAPLSITGISGVNKAYDGTTAATLTGTPVYNGLMNSETFTVTGTATATFGNAAVANNKTVTVTGYTAPSTNYSITQPTGLTANITAIPSTWNGTGSWSSNANWTAVPNAGTDVTVPSGSSLTVDGTPTVNNITIEAGGKLNVSSALIALGTVTLKAANDGISFSTKLDAGITASSVRLFKTIDATKWYFVSFPCDVPVANITKADGTSLGTLGTDWFIKYYDGAQRGESGSTLGSNWKQITSGTLTANQGYIIALSTGTAEILFPLNTSILAAEAAPKTIAVSAYTGAAATTNYGWNLIGQPFLSNYITSNATGADTYYIYVSDGVSTYSPYSSALAPNINPMSAYFVQASTALAGSGITFATAGRQLVRSSVFKTDVSDQVQLNFSTATGMDYTNLIMDNTQTTDYQIGRDLEKWIGTDTNKPQVYTQLGGINYAFNALPMDNVYKLPLGFYTKTAGQTTISVDASKAPGLSQLMLTDNSNGATVDLLTSNYSFNAASGTDNARFVLTAKRVATAITPIGTGNDEPVITAENGKLVLGNLTGVTNVRVYDAIGHMLFNKIATTNLVEVPISVAGVYTIQLNASTKNWTKKQVVNQK